MMPASDLSRVVVKFNAAYAQTHRIPYDERIEQHPEQYLGRDWTHLVGQFPGLTIQRIVTSLTSQQLIDIVTDAKIKAERHDRTYPYPANHFLTYFAVCLSSGIDPEAVTEVLRSWKTIELAYIEGRVTLPSGVKPGTTTESSLPSILAQQPYLGPAPDGINAVCAWHVPGGDGGTDVGLDLRFADLEQGWNLAHLDLPTSGIQSILGSPGAGNAADIDHGTLVLGIVLAVPNNMGCVGITPNVTTTMLTSCYPGRTGDVCNAIAAAIPPPPDNSKLGPGDVLLLEAQMANNAPVEIDSVVYQYIYNATVRNIVVVEAAGNGGFDLDTYTYPYQGPALLNRGSSQFRESLGIMVGAATTTPVAPRLRKTGSNFGNRIDCYAWGDSVYSTSASNPSGYGTLSDTSAATAIIAGAALSIQGIAQQSHKGNLPNYRFSPDQLRSILRHPASGTVSGTSTWSSTMNSTWEPVQNPDFLKWNADKIGVMPNLSAIIWQRFEINCSHFNRHILDDLVFGTHDFVLDPGPK